MKFLTVIQNTDERKQAVFEHEDFHYLYSYSKIDDASVNETMVFSCDENGEVLDYTELYTGYCYVPSDEVMKKIAENKKAEANNEV
tara:strand:+ start:3874 stop:4131 length:258 start_codon:yes stop_codon:yes gene_type:complete